MMVNAMKTTTINHPHNKLIRCCPLDNTIDHSQSTGFFAVIRGFRQGGKYDGVFSPYFLFCSFTSALFAQEGDKRGRSFVLHALP